MNKKGFTLIELVISIVLISIIIIPTFAIILNFKNRQLLASDKQELVKFKNLITSDIEDDILQQGLRNVTMDKDSCSNPEEDCTIKLEFGQEQDKKEKNLIINIKGKTIKYGDEVYKLAVPYAEIMSDNDMRLYLQQGYLEINPNNEKNNSITKYFQIKIPITYVNDTTGVESINYGINIIAEKRED